MLCCKRKEPFCKDITLQVCSGVEAATGAVMGVVAVGGSRGGAVLCRWR